MPLCVFVLFFCLTSLLFIQQLGTMPHRAQLMKDALMMCLESRNAESKERNRTCGFPSAAVGGDESTFWDKPSILPSLLKRTLIERQQERKKTKPDVRVRNPSNLKKRKSDAAQHTTHARDEECSIRAKRTSLQGAVPSAPRACLFPFPSRLTSISTKTSSEAIKSWCSGHLVTSLVWWGLSYISRSQRAFKCVVFNKGNVCSLTEILLNLSICYLRGTLKTNYNKTTLKAVRYQIEKGHHEADGRTVQSLGRSQG